MLSVFILSLSLISNEKSYVGSDSGVQEYVHLMFMCGCWSVIVIVWVCDCACGCVWQYIAVAGLY